MNKYGPNAAKTPSEARTYANNLATTGECSQYGKIITEKRDLWLEAARLMGAETKENVQAAYDIWMDYCIHDTAGFCKKYYSPSTGSYRNLTATTETEGGK